GHDPVSPYDVSGSIAVAIQSFVAPRVLHSFPTRRSSDLGGLDDAARGPALDDGAEVHHGDAIGDMAHDCQVVRDEQVGEIAALADRKSTRLNSSHVKTSYAVFCLKKKKACTGEQTSK